MRSLNFSRTSRCSLVNCRLLATRVPSTSKTKAVSSLSMRQCSPDRHVRPCRVPVWFHNHVPRPFVGQSVGLTGITPRPVTRDCVRTVSERKRRFRLCDHPAFDGILDQFTGTREGQNTPSTNPRNSRRAWAAAERKRPPCCAHNAQRFHDHGNSLFIFHIHRRCTRPCYAQRCSGQVARKEPGRTGTTQGYSDTLSAWQRLR